MQQEEILVKSTLDGSMQPSLFFGADDPCRPLLVGLHTWSFDRFNQVDRLLPLAKKHNFNLLLPEFRGPNLNTNPNCIYACGSEYAKQDIKDAIDYAVSRRQVDQDNIFLLGCSGGGHMALLMAGMYPELFKAIAAYVPICDLEKWVDQSQKYAPHVVACCGDNEQLYKRSPKAYIDTIAKANLKIFHGKFDNVVPVSHSIDLYNAIINKYPDSRVFLDIFDGGHQYDGKTAEHWILSQYKKTEIAKVTG